MTTLNGIENAGQRILLDASAGPVIRHRRCLDRFAKDHAGGSRKRENRSTVCAHFILPFPVDDPE
jgi:hypothetical protein